MSVRTASHRDGGAVLRAPTDPDGLPAVYQPERVHRELQLSVERCAAGVDAVRGRLSGDQWLFGGVPHGRGVPAEAEGAVVPEDCWAVLEIDAPADPGADLLLLGLGTPRQRTAVGRRRGEERQPVQAQLLEQPAVHPELVPR
uniref:(northern house mosquito) hypothetical protein n=1 Tax=Culex pipiens TaxID=7175 RepID=A0A8D8G6S9_CULPI